MGKLNNEQLEKLASRKAYYDNDILQMNTSVYKAKNSNLPFLNKKAEFVYRRLMSNDIAKGYTYTFDSLTNDYRKEVETLAKAKAKNQDKYNFRKSFKSSEVVDVATIKAVIQYAYHSNNRLFEYYRNAKGNYLIKEVEFVSNLSTLKEHKETTLKDLQKVATTKKTTKK